MAIIKGQWSVLKVPVFAYRAVMTKEPRLSGSYSSGGCKSGQSVWQGMVFSLLQKCWWFSLVDLFHEKNQFQSSVASPKGHIFQCQYLGDEISKWSSGRGGTHNRSVHNGINGPESCLSLQCLAASLGKSYPCVGVSLCPEDPHTQSYVRNSAADPNSEIWAFPWLPIKKVATM